MQSRLKISSELTTQKLYCWSDKNVSNINWIEFIVPSFSGQLENFKQFLTLITYIVWWCYWLLFNRNLGKYIWWYPKTFEGESFGIKLRILNQVIVKRE